MADDAKNYEDEMYHHDTNFRPRERGQFRQRIGFMPPKNKFNGNLTFTSSAHQAQFEQIQHRPLPVREQISRIECSDVDTSTGRRP
ncbi:hypothetical protein ES332_D08G183700v1 [Gossypium tomentosum]|uniref:Uncharacterized protein n=1 Tax=Gossypium tomentosum TaxID=34277 RepID=A0A5D2JWJ7_GOSTO|nr:hypothetical protein ES332_D08G183700v1 [Gossypium tomentosum]